MTATIGDVHPGSDVVAREYALAAAAGLFSVLLFTWIHALTISDIWAMLIPMGVIGGLCGVSIYWSYRRAVQAPSLRSWVVLNLVFMLVISSLAPLSAVVFEPVTTLDAIMASGGPVPPEILARALPLTLMVTIVGAIGTTAVFGWSWSRFRPVLAALTVVMITLGMNMSAVGLVEFPSAASYAPVLRFIALVVMLGVVYAATLWLVLAGSRRATSDRAAA